MNASRETASGATASTNRAALAQAFGRNWIQSRRSALLIVPSIVTAGRDANVVVNPDHPDARRISVGPETPVVLDLRLFGP
jgi:RES domain-containing protein